MAGNTVGARSKTAKSFDASALAKRYLQEGDSGTLLALLDAPACTSRLREVEVASTLLRRAREGSLVPEERDRLLADLERDLNEMLIVELTPAIIPFVVFDTRLREAAVAEGLTIAPGPSS